METPSATANPRFDATTTRRAFKLLGVGGLIASLGLLYARIEARGGAMFLPQGRMYIPEASYSTGNIDVPLVDGLLWQLAILCMAIALVGLWPKWLFARIRAVVCDSNARTFLVAVFVFMLAATSTVSWLVFDHHPRDVDHVARVFQARTLASGALSVPAPPVSDSFGAYAVLEKDGRVFAKYAPGGALFLALAEAVTGAQWIAHPLLGALIPLLLFAALRNFYPEPVVRTAVVLMCASPFYLFMAGSFHSHVPCLFFLSAFLALIAPAYESGSRTRFAAAGVCLGLALATRQYTAMLAAWPFAAYVLISAKPAESVKRAIACAAGGALPLICLLAYNAHLTGDALTFPFHLADAYQKPWFGYKGHTPLRGLFADYGMLKLLNLTLFGAPGSLFFFAVAAALLPKNRWDRLLLASGASLLLGYTTYYWYDFSNGPRYYFEAFPLLAVLSARGILGLHEAMERLKIDDVGPTGCRDFAAGWVAASLAFCALCYLPSLSAFYANDYNGNFKLPLHEAVQAAGLEDAIVFLEPLPGQNGGFGSGLLANPIDLSSAPSVLFARDLGQAKNAAVASAYPGRSLWRYVYEPASAGGTLSELDAR